MLRCAALFWKLRMIVNFVTETAEFMKTKASVFNEDGTKFDESLLVSQKYYSTITTLCCMLQPAGNVT